jgi:hypothetical protein
MSVGSHNNEQVLKNTSDQYSILISKTFGDNINEDHVVKTAVALKSIKRIQWCTTSDVTVELKFSGILPANNKTIMQLSNTGEFVFDGMSQSDSLKIDRTIFNGLLAISTHNVKEGAGYTIVVSGTK